MYRLFVLSFVLIFSMDALRVGAQTSSRLIQKTSFQADSLGNLAEIQDTAYVYSSGRGSDMKTHQYFYDTAWIKGNGSQLSHRELKSYLADGRVKEWIIQFLEPGQQWKNYRRKLYYYRGVNTLDSLIEQQWNDFNKVWWNYSALRYQYNTQGDLVDEKKDSWYLNAYVEEFWTHYDYSGGRLSQKESFYYHKANNLWVSLDKTEYSYQGNALIREEWSRWDSLTASYIPQRAIDYSWKSAQIADSTVEWQWDTLGSRWAPRFLHRYTYNGNQQVSADTLYQYIQPQDEWALSHLVLHQYDTAGNQLEKSEWMHMGGNWVPQFQWTWTYNSFHQPLTEDRMRWSSPLQQWVPVLQGPSRLEYQYELYNPTGISVRVTANPFRLYPNPVHRQMTLEIPAPASSRIKARLIDMQGRTIQQWTWSAKGSLWESLDVNQMPAGNYVFQLEMGKERHQQTITISPR